jgi:uncharacterized protein (DUF4415 family)
MKKLTGKQRARELRALASIPDDRIDTSDIPELTGEQLSRAIRGGMYRPVKKPVTLRLDADVIEWLKHDGPGYQTKANALLRREMVRWYAQKKSSGRRVAGGARPTKAGNLAGV